MHDILQVTKPPKVTGSFFDHPLLGGGRAVGMGRFLRVSPEEEKVEVDWAQLIQPDCTFRKHAVRIARQLGITEFIAPEPNADTWTRSPEEMPCVLDLGEGISLRYGAGAEGCYPLYKRQAYLLQSGGCPAVRVHYQGDVAKGIWPRTGAGHGSLKSFLNELPSHLIRAMQLTPEQLKDTFVSIIAPISPLYFNHPTTHTENGQKHRSLCLHIADTWGHRCVPSIDKDRSKNHSGHIDLGELGTVQFQRLGVPRKQITVVASTVDASPRHSDGSTRWYTTRNYPRYSGNPEDERLWKKRRNLIIVTAP